MFYIGLMSGTSVDGIDAVLVTIEAMGTAKVRTTHHHPYPPEVRGEIHGLSHSTEASLDQIGVLDRKVGEVFAEAVRGLLIGAGLRAAEIRAIGSHGQTIRHRPDSRPPFSMQIGNPSVIAEITGITTVADFRARDMAAGGQGAPLVPAFHAAHFRAPKEDRVILNIGGIANITHLPADTMQPVQGFDTGPGNTLLDQWIMRHKGERMDRDGRWASTAEADADLLAKLLADPYFSKMPPKSTGRELFNVDWLDSHLATLGRELPPEVVQATLLTLTAHSIRHALTTFVPTTREVYVCGGGAYNRALMFALSECLGGSVVETTRQLGIEPSVVEATAFAWLAHQTLEGKPGNLPSVTGARRAVILGGIYKA